MSDAAGFGAGLSRADRVEFLREIVREITTNTDEWTLTSLDVVLGQFGCGSIDTDDGWSGWADQFARAVGKVSDRDLLEIYAVITGADPREARSALRVIDASGIWKPADYVRVFISHTAAEKAFAAEVSTELAVFGVVGFVAHESMEIEKSWQDQIEAALRTCEAFVALVHAPVNQSVWCQQEIGWARGRDVPSYFVRLGADPVGFVSSTQWPSLVNRDAKAVAVNIARWLDRSGSLRKPLVQGLIGELREAGNYFDAEAAAKRIVALDDLDDETWDLLAEAYHANDQVHGGVLPTRVLKPFYQQHRHTFPPPKPPL